MDSVESLREAIARVFDAWEHRYTAPEANFRILGVMDTRRDQYLLVHDPKGATDSASLLAHLEIRNGKIWVEQDETEEGLANQLVELGVSRSSIVLGFQPESLRRYTDFAVA